jgi:hypothetical protein
MRRVFVLTIVLSTALHGAPQAGTVDADSLPVYSKASATSPVRGTLKRGDSVTIHMVLQTNRGNWCDVSGAADVSGYVECGLLKQAPVEEIVRKAGAKPPDIDALITEALRLSGLTRNAAAMANPAAFQRLYDAITGGKIGKQQSAEFVRIFEQVYTPEKLTAAVKARLRTGHSSEEWLALLDQLQSPVARRMALLGQSPSAVRQTLQSFQDQLSVAPPERARVDLVARVERDHGGVDASSLESVPYILRGVLQGWRVSPQQIEIEVRRAISQMPADLRGTIQSQETVLILYAYRSASDADLNEYAAFLESQPVQWFFRDLHQGVLDLVQQTGFEMVTLGHLSPPSR